MDKIPTFKTMELTETGTVIRKTKKNKFKRKIIEKENNES